MTIREALTMGQKMLSRAGVANPALDSQVILSKVLNKGKLELLRDDRDKIPSPLLKIYKKKLSLRCKFIPVAYIIGRKEFYGLDFYVNRHVLIPRPETEFAVEEVLKSIKGIKKPKIADLCCGSGAISVAVAVNCPTCIVYASDISEKACQVAGINSKKHKVQDRVTVLRGDLWEPFEKNCLKDFDIIVSNPPYIPEEELSHLMPDVQHEPKTALNGGKDGLEFYKKIISKASRFLKPRGKIILEIGYNQADKVKDILESSGFYETEVVKDLAGYDRIITAVYPNLQ